ncbi:MAG: hypothetical protein ACM3MF_07470 [Anaerolineae bacterium]
MGCKHVAFDDAAEAPPISPDTLAEVKKEDMKEAVVERFRGRIKNPAAARRARGSREPQSSEKR